MDAKLGAAKRLVVVAVTALAVGGCAHPTRADGNASPTQRLPRSPQAAAIAYVRALHDSDTTMEHALRCRTGTVYIGRPSGRSPIAVRVTHILRRGQVWHAEVQVLVRDRVVNTYRFRIDKRDGRYEVC